MNPYPPQEPSGLPALVQPSIYPAPQMYPPPVPHQVIVVNAPPPQIPYVPRRRGIGGLHALHLILTILSCGLWAFVWVGHVIIHSIIDSNRVKRERADIAAARQAANNGPMGDVAWGHRRPDHEQFNAHYPR